MNLNEVKVALGVESISLNKVVTADNVETAWFKAWDNTNRIAILMHKDTLATIKANKAIVNLGINTQVKQGAKGEYTAKTICIYTPADEIL